MAHTMLTRKATGTKPFSSARPHGLPQVQLRQPVSVRSTGWADPAATTAERTMFGDNFGARDPYAAEIESNFGEKVLGNYNTDHIIKIPTSFKEHIGLTSHSCSAEAGSVRVADKELNLLKQQVPGWKVITNAAGHETLRHEWRLRSPEAAAQLQGLINTVAEAEGHAPSITLSGDILIAELSTPAVAGLSMNDLILAAKVNDLNVKELVPPPRKRYWA